MKKIISLLLVATLVFAFSACGKNKDTTVKENTNKTTEQKQTDKVVDDKAGATDENDDDSQTENSNKLENNSSNEQSPADSKTDTNNTTTNDNSNKNNNQSNGNGTTTKPNTNTQTNTHKHSFSAATCTTPKKCSCGATEGKALGHTYTNATCTTPKTCSVCKATSGSELGHNYDIDGVCTRCKAKDPNFTYPTVSSMGGSWITVVYTDDESAFSRHRLACIFDVFGKSTFDIADMFCVLEEELAEEFPDVDIDETAPLIWDNKCYYCFGGGFLCAENTTYNETDDTVKIVDGNNKTMILQRVSTNTMKVKSVDSGFADDKLTVNTILKFYED